MQSLSISTYSSDHKHPPSVDPLLLSPPPSAPRQISMASTDPRFRLFLLLLAIGAAKGANESGLLPDTGSAGRATNFYNFSAATSAASFVGEGNRTFISCDKFDDQRAADRACNSLLGHTHGECNPFPAYGNTTFVAICRCITYAGLTPPGSCVDASCVWGADACAVRQGSSYLLVVLNSFSLMLTAYVFGFGLFVIVAGRNVLGTNPMTVTLVSMTGASMFHALWRCAAFVRYSILLSAVPGAEVQKLVGMPGFIICGVIGLLAFPLQWIEVAKKAKQTTRRGNSNKKPHVAVAIVSFMLGAAAIFFVVTGKTFLLTGEFVDARIETVRCVTPTAVCMSEGGKEKRRV